MIDRRDFLKSVAAAYVATKVPPDVYGLSEADAEFMFPSHPAPGDQFQVRLHGKRTMKWPSNVLWQSGHTPVPSGGCDLFRFESGGGYWLGSVIQDFR